MITHIVRRKPGALSVLRRCRFSTAEPVEQNLPSPSSTEPHSSPSSSTVSEQIVKPRKDQSHGIYAGDNILEYTSTMEIVKPEKHPKWPVYRVLDTDGQVRKGAVEPDLNQDTMQQMYRVMARLQAMDTIFYNAQRQGRISFYMTSMGEEATHIGTAAALASNDLVLAQYREAGVLMWRGFDLNAFADQCFSNENDLGKGRQMPIHYGTAALHYQTISSPLATQIPQAVGAAYGFKIGKEPRIAICYFGEGAASEGDFHAGLNFAATLQAPVIFFCRNNGYAISTPVKDQFRGDGIVSRAIGYGMHAIRVDGNDLLAVYNATKAAREICLKEHRPVLIEAMTYRIGHHSTSDDSTRYRSLTEIKQWQDHDDPVTRLRKYMEKKGWWNQEQETKQRDAERMAVLRALEHAEGKPKPGLHELFTDIYAEKPPHLIEQEEALHEHIAKYPQQYKTDGPSSGGSH